MRTALELVYTELVPQERHENVHVLAGPSEDRWIATRTIGERDRDCGTEADSKLLDSEQSQPRLSPLQGAHISIRSGPAGLGRGRAKCSHFLAWQLSNHLAQSR